MQVAGFLKLKVVENLLFLLKPRYKGACCPLVFPERIALRPDGLLLGNGNAGYPQ